MARIGGIIAVPETTRLNHMENMEHQESEFKSKSGLQRIFKAFGYSMDGFKAAWKYEHAFRQELLLVIIGSIVAVNLPVSAFQKLVLVGVLILVMVVELVNAAIEAVVDRISLERHPLSKRAKDLGSAAVFLAFVLAMIAWGVVLFYRFY